MENDVGIVLGVLLGSIITISSMWLVVGISRLIDSWNKRYGDYVRESMKEI